jgi:Ca2+:H+ antiporter
MCFFTGGTRFSEQGFGMSSCSAQVFITAVLTAEPMTGATQLNSSLLTLSVIAVLLPAAFHSTAQPSNGVDPLTDAQEAHDILAVSRGASGFFFV